MKYSVNDKLLESDKPLNLGEIFTKLEFGSDIIGGEIEGEIKIFILLQIMMPKSLQYIQILKKDYY